jgi:hypothetical protein
MDDGGLGFIVGSLIGVIYLLVITAIGIAFYFKKRRALAFFWLSFSYDIACFVYFNGIPNGQRYQPIFLVVWPLINLFLLGGYLIWKRNLNPSD